MDIVAVPFLSEGRPHQNETSIPFGYVSEFYSDMEAPYLQAMEVDNEAGAEMLPLESKSAVRSCTTCSKAKAKCVKRPDQQTCER